jgi:hypothetical protein
MVGDLAAKVAKRNRVEHEQTGKTGEQKLKQDRTHQNHKPGAGPTQLNQTL